MLAPLALRQLAELRTQIETLGKHDSLDANVEAALPIIHASLLRNYPDITIEDVRGLIDAANVTPAVQATLPRAPGAVTASEASHG